MPLIAADAPASVPDDDLYAKVTPTEDGGWHVAVRRRGNDLYRGGYKFVRTEAEAREAALTLLADARQVRAYLARPSFEVTG